MVAGTHPPHPLKTKMDGGAGVAPLLRPDNQPLFGDTAIMEMDAHHLSSPHLNSAQYCTMGKHVGFILFIKDYLNWSMKVIQNAIKKGGFLGASEPRTPKNKNWSPGGYPECSAVTVLVLQHLWCSICNL